MIEKRYKMLKYLKRTDYHSYKAVIEKFGIAEVTDGLHKENFRNRKRPPLESFYPERDPEPQLPNSENLK